MSLQQKIQNIINYYIKTHYTSYLNENNIKYIPDNNIENVINDLYKNESKNIKNFIRSSLKKMMDDYPSTLIENIILEIFSDENYAKQRIVTEIRLYQEQNKKDLENEIINNSYEVYLTPNKLHGIGLIINVENNGIFVKNFKKINDIILPAEKCELINIGDRLIKINDHELDKITINDSINLLKNYNSKSDEITLKFINKIQINSN